MNRRSSLFLAPALILVLALAASARAGGDNYHKCTMETQACLDKMASYYAKAGWLGIEYDNDAKTGAVTITGIVPGSPAESVHLAKGDVLVALDGIPINEASHEKLSAAREKMSPGTKVTYTIRRGGKDSAIAVTLAEMPKEVLARAVGQHLLDHVTVQTAAK